jgi:hypothetical protein
VSEELENSLQQAIETYLNDRLRTIDEQVSRLQTEVSEALARLRESSTAESLSGTTLSAAIFAHLQTARGQKLTGAMASPSAQRDAGTIKRAVEEIEAQQTQTDILKSLLLGAVQFAERVALFVIKNDQAIGWRVCEASEPSNLELIGGVSLPLTTETILTQAVRSRSACSGDPRSTSQDQMVIDQLGGSPQVVVSVPLIVRGKAVAVLYADSASADSSAINSDALEVLVRVAAMAVNLVSVHRAATEQRPVPADAKPAEQMAQPEPAAEAEPTYTPEVEAQVTEVESHPVTAEAIEPSAPVEPEPEDVSTSPATETVPDAIPAKFASPQPSPISESSSPAIAEAQPWVAPTGDTASSTEPQTQAAPPAPAFVSEYVTPLGSSRRFGVSEPELPIEVSEEERRLHNDARRFARLLVSEIKLYNEPKVKEGRSNGDLYERLREDIDRSRQMYDKRVAPPVAARHDYFHQELVNMLAEGDAGKLGGSYPGVSAN